MNLPSIKTIKNRLNLDADTAKTIRAFMEKCVFGYVVNGPSPEYPQPVLDWSRSCYHAPSRREKCLASIACILTDGRDTSFEVFQPQEEWDNYTDGPSWEAVNMGDTYDDTVIYRNGRFSIGAWGDLPEVNR